ncbi:hypothetical protein ACA910_018499 [Epithemia clementina (nom. ined.)]
MLSNKLQPIYAALDSHQFSRAIKLCLALPTSFLIGQALLAHAYAKSSQRYKALVVIQGIFGSEGFPELQLEIKYALERRQDAEVAVGSSQTNSSLIQPSQAATPARKGGKKGKKKPTVKATSAHAISPNASLETQDEIKDFDWIDQLDSPPNLPNNWEETLPPREPPSDHTLLATISMTLTSLRLQLTAYQMYMWCIATNSNDLELVCKTYLLGLSVWIAPQYQSISAKILEQLQVTALQMARLQQEQHGVSPATAWAAQTALWQIDPVMNRTTIDERKATTLPRLAESLASKSIQITTDDHVLETENFMLYLRSLDVQSKWEEKLAAIQERLDSKEHKNPREDALRGIKASCLITLGRREEACVEMARLLNRHPDNWEYWKMYMSSTDISVESLKFIEELIEKTKNEPYPLRGPHLAKVQRESIRLQNSDESEMLDLIREITTYGNMLAQRASCTFNDLSSYLRYILDKGNVDDALSILDWVKSVFLSIPDNEDPKVRRNQIRGYIFGVQVSYLVVVSHPMLEEEWLPSWKDIVKVWKDFQAFENPDQAQKESRAADDLILLAVQQLVRSDNDTTQHNLMIAAAILEAAIAYSPHNAYLKIAEIFVYSSLNAVGRSFELFRQIYVKHIQHESCSYIILPLLRAGGFYQEIIMVCQEILRLQTSSIRDAAEFTGRAMEGGTLEKATEFVTFQRERMNKSLTTLEAKGLILDCAPMYQQDEDQGLGAVHGIVGGPEDNDRVCKMIAEAHNPHAAFSLLRLRGNATDNLESFTENRDFDILSFNILAPRKLDSPLHILNEAIRRRHHHSLLIRASLCLDSTKGPKKGKITKSSDELSKRCSSLLSCVADSEEYMKNASCQAGLERTALATMLLICQAILAVSGGVVRGNDNTLDSLEAREDATASFLRRAVESMKECHSDFIEQSKENAVPLVSRFIADCLVSIFALFQMCASALEVYGWGKRKRGTRQSAGAMADFAVAMKELIGEMKLPLNTLPREQDTSFASGLDHVLNQGDIETLCKKIADAQLETKRRIDKILSKMVETCEGFDVDI